MMLKSTKNLGTYKLSKNIFFIYIIDFQAQNGLLFFKNPYNIFLIYNNSKF